VQFNNKNTLLVAFVVVLAFFVISSVKAAIHEIFGHQPLLWFSQYTIIFFILHSRLLAQTPSTSAAVAGWI